VEVVHASREKLLRGGDVQDVPVDEDLGELTGNSQLRGQDFRLGTERRDVPDRIVHKVLNVTQFRRMRQAAGAGKRSPDAV